VVGSGLEVVEERVSALEPAVRHGRLATELEEIGGEPGGDPRRRGVVATLEIETVRPLAGVNGQRIISEEVAGPAQTLERLRRLRHRESLLEANPSALPVAHAEGPPALLHLLHPDLHVDHGPRSVPPPRGSLVCGHSSRDWRRHSSSPPWHRFRHVRDATSPVATGSLPQPDRSPYERPVTVLLGLWPAGRTSR
jgi:hypothetical protein